MGYFVKKPVTIEAFEFDGSITTGERIKTWALYYGTVLVCQETMDGVCELAIPIPLGGLVYATPGDFIIRGIDDRFYPCKPDIFLESHTKL